MALPLPIPPLRLFEIDDQSWFPSTLRLSVQACLTIFWKIQAPLLQSSSAASLVARTLQSVLGKENLKNYTFVDFCSGAGGPTPYIEREVNKECREARDGRARINGENGYAEEVDEGVDFVMTDIHPHLAAWSKASKRSDNVRYVPRPVDAANAPSNVLALAGASDNKKAFRLFSLAFHHFDDPLAIRILKNTLETSDGFAIFELQGRDVGNLITCLTLWPVLWLGSWYWFWGQWGHLFWTYVIPIVPFVIVFDGLVSCLRTRREGEIMNLIGRTGVSTEGWRFEAGGEMNAWPTGTMQYFIGIKEGEAR